MQFIRSHLSTLFSVLFLFSAVETISAGTLTVNSLQDNTTAGDGLVTLREAIIAANNNTTTDLGHTGTADDTIQIRLSGTMHLTSAMPAVTSTIRIQGSGRESLEINGQGQHSFLSLTNAATVILEDLTVRNCFNSTNGGAVSTMGQFTATRCDFLNNRISMPFNFNMMGSAIYGGSGVSTITLQDCVIGDNETQVLGDGSFYIGSAVGTIGKIDASRCLFTNNSTSGTGSSAQGMGNTLGTYNGGVITLSECTISGGHFKQPASLTAWGAVYVGVNGSSFTADSCTWTRNKAATATCLYTIASTTGSPVNTIQLKNCTFSNNGSTASGPMILIYPNASLNMTIEHCTFADNATRTGVSQTLDANPSPNTNVQIANTVMANTDSLDGRFEIKSTFPFISNGFNFISNPGTSLPSQPVMSYANTTATKVSDLVQELADNGGHTQTCALPAGSPLIDAANPAGFAAEDQRGITRPRNGDTSGTAAPDIGAYERFVGDLRITKSVDRTTAVYGSTLNYYVAVTNAHPTEQANEVTVEDVLPPNLQFNSILINTFGSATVTDNVIRATRPTLPPGGTASLLISCSVKPVPMINTATASQLGVEQEPSDNTAQAATALLTPIAPHVRNFSPDGPTVTSATAIRFLLEFDQPVTGLDINDFAIAPGSPSATLAGVSDIGQQQVYHVALQDITGTGPFQLLLNDDDSILSLEGLPMGGYGPGDSIESTTVTIDTTLPQSAPIAATAALGETQSNVFFLLMQASDDLAGIADIRVHIRKLPGGIYQEVPGGPFNEFALIDLNNHGGFGSYELYTVATDKAGNTETKTTPDMVISITGDSESAAIDWELYH